MRPPWSILIFTTLAGAAQGFFIMLFGVEVWAGGARSTGVYAGAAWTVLALLALGLVAAVFHLGRPGRAWRAASQWRSSWMSREVIVLPALMIAIGLHALLLQNGADPASAGVRATGLVAALFCVGLWWCTGMIYASLAMLREWATPLTPFCFTALGLASGAGLAGVWFAYAAIGNAASQPTQTGVAALAASAGIFTLAAVALKGAWWRRLRALPPRLTLQSALGIAHRQIRQLSMGMTGGCFNLREFFHGQAGWVLRVLPLLMIVLGALLPLIAYAVAWQRAGDGHAPAAASIGLGVLCQLLGILAERWLFFAWVRHPQNLYYQRVS
jgi:sulfite dehydrogenase (quinone) subunit SoeC